MVMPLNSSSLFMALWGVVTAKDSDLDRNPDNLEGAEGLCRNEKDSCFWNMHGQWNKERGEGERVRQKTGNGGDMNDGSTGPSGGQRGERESASW